MTVLGAVVEALMLPMLHARHHGTVANPLITEFSLPLWQAPEVQDIQGQAI
jgi:hypothetical protein